MSIAKERIIFSLFLWIFFRVYGIIITTLIEKIYAFRYNS